MKFIHCADVHLDTPLQGLTQYEGAPVNEIRNATRRAFERVVDAALAEQINFLVIAGDLYDVGLRSFETALFFNKEMSRLANAGIDVYLIHGNHDAASKLIKHVRPPKNVHVFRADKPQTFRKDDLHVAVHGQSFDTPEVTRDLAANYPEPISGLFNIGVLHTNLSGTSEHANYAPCSFETLKNKGYQYWALGHVHNRQILCTDPYIVYPGNIQGRHGKEQGEKSCELVTVTDAGAISVQSIPTSVLPWLAINVDVSECADADEVYDKVRLQIRTVMAQNGDRVIALRVIISGTTEAHADLNRNPESARAEVISVANECGSGALWVERVQITTVPKLDTKIFLQRDDPIGEVLRTISALRADPERLSSWDVIAELQAKLPKEDGGEPLSLDANTLRTALEEAEALLLARLASGETG